MKLSYISTKIILTTQKMRISARTVEKYAMFLPGRKMHCMTEESLYGEYPS